MAGEFLSAAQLGGAAGFAVDTASGHEMIMSLGGIRTELQQTLANINDLKERAKLGDLYEAQAIANLDREVATGNPQSLEHVMQQFVERLDEAQQALKIGMRNYEEMEFRAEQAFGQADPQ